MAKIKWDPAATPLNNEHDGYTFQRNNYGFSMFPASRSARKRYERQFLRMHPNQKAVTQWRNMPQSVKDQWALFASTFPQPAIKDPNIFLNGFECFVKRNYFCFLNHGIHSDFMLEPDLIVNEGEPITFAIKTETTAIECAELYINNFGLLPKVGDKLLLYAAVYSEYTGHFYESINTYAIVEEIYIDSMQIAVYIPDTFNEVTVSVYLSKPVSPGVSYVGTKIRYMGCFTTKKFTELQDTPGSYTGNAGKIPAVKDDETGLEFVEGGGGGLTCEDLADCPTIQEIQEQIENLQEFISISDNTSIPPGEFFGVYNGYAMLNSSPPYPIGWSPPLDSDFDNLYTFLGGADYAGGILKDTSSKYWIDPNTGATNEVKFNWRGTCLVNTSGYIDNTKELSKIWCGNGVLAWSVIYIALARYDSAKAYTPGYYSYKYGCNFRLKKDTTSLSEGQSGTMQGNDGKIYRTICINGIEWLADHSMETKFRDGSLIPIVNDPTTWGNSESPCMRLYDFEGNLLS